MAESSQWGREHIISFAQLLQTPVIAVDCPNNCGCNPTCGCESKPGCCENKCSRNQDGRDIIPDWEEIVTNPAFREIVANFDSTQLRTIEDFKALTQDISAKLTNR